MIKTVDDFLDIYDQIHSKNQETFLEYCKDTLPTIIKTVSDFSYICENISEKHLEVVIHVLKDVWPTFMKDESDFSDVCKALSKERRKVVLQALAKQQGYESITTTDYFRLACDEHKSMASKMVEYFANIPNNAFILFFSSHARQRDEDTASNPSIDPLSEEQDKPLLSR